MKIDEKEKEKEKGRGKEKEKTAVVSKGKAVEGLLMERVGSGDRDMAKVADAAAMPSPESLDE